MAPGDNVETQLPQNLDIYRQPLDYRIRPECPFCENWERTVREQNPQFGTIEAFYITPKQYQHHVGAHMDQLALFAISGGVVDDNRSQSNATTGENYHLGRLLSLGEWNSKVPSNTSSSITEVQEGSDTPLENYPYSEVMEAGEETATAMNVSKSEHLHGRTKDIEAISESVIHSTNEGPKWDTNISAIGSKDTTTEDFRRKSLSREFKIAQSRDFKEGRVFKVVWTEPIDSRAGVRRKNYSYINQSYGELGYTSIRRFVIRKNYDRHSLCLPILTYGGHGTSKRGINPQDHAIIFTELTSNKPPVKAEGEPILPNAPICVELLNPRYQFDEMSCLNYGKVYTVEHNLKVCFIGRIHKKSVKEFEAAYNRVHNNYNSLIRRKADGEMYGIDDGDDDGDDDSVTEEEEEHIHPDNVGYRY